MEDLRDGYIKTINSDSRFGFVSASTPLPDRYRRQDVYFRWNEADDSEFGFLCKGTQVQFRIDENSSIEKPGANELHLVEGDVTIELKVATSYRERGRRYHGNVNDDMNDRSTSNRARDRTYSRKPGRSQSRESGRGNNAAKAESGVGKANTSKQQPAPKTQIGDALTGVIVDIKRTDTDNPFGFIQPDLPLPLGFDPESQVRFYCKSVKPQLIKPNRGDAVKFVLGSKDKTKPHAIRVYVTVYKPRSISVIEPVLREIHAMLGEIEENKSGEELIQIVTATEMWRCIAHCYDMSEKCIQIFLNILLKMSNMITGLKSNFIAILDAIMKTKLFALKNGTFKVFIKSVVEIKDNDWIERVREVLLMLVEHLPQSVRVVTQLISLMLSEDKTSVDNFVYRILRSSIRHTDTSDEFAEWTELPLVPSTNEILHGPREGAFNLQPVRTTGPYKSVDEYLDIYFRLFRADCFSALNKGIQDLLNGVLDNRDMNAYHNISLYGIHINSNDMPISIAVKLTPFRKVKNWDKSRNLMFGNLVCLSVNGTFHDSIWATVISRELLNSKGVVVMELCSESNALSDSEAMLCLEQADSRSILVESPTYYRAYQPVLRHLQSMKANDIPFQTELVNGCDSGNIPEFIQLDSTINASVCYENRSSMMFHELCFPSQYDKSTMRTSLDRTQESAFKESLARRVAIVQGPPGTGKTFIGAKLVQAIDSISSKPDTPILILTYKNHALDEFMKHLSTIYPDDIVRIGGRQQDPELARYNLTNLRRDKQKSKNLYDNMRDQRSILDHVGKNIEKTYKAGSSKKIFDANMFIESVNDEQLRQWLLECPWEKIRASTILGQQKDGDDDGFAEILGKSRKRKKGRVLDSQEIKVVLDMINCPLLSYFNTIEDETMLKIQYGLKQAIKEALIDWLPSRSSFNSLNKTFNHAPVVDLSRFVKESEYSDKDIEDDGDDEDAKKEESERQEATGVKIMLGNIIRPQDTTPTGGEEWKPKKFSIPREYTTGVFASRIVDVASLWDLRDDERIIFVQLILHRHATEAEETFKQELLNYKAALASKTELETIHSLSILQEKKFVGMTITGASIHCYLIAQLKPQIVMIEEAAEVMEPQLLSCLGPWVQQLILIGDHKQLRPAVENYTLKREYHLDVSLMERLINNKLQYSTLELQNRMRIEFASMLKDIYPNLQSNHSRVLRNTPTLAVEKTMFFWTHREHENEPDSKGNTGRSRTNDEEADRCINLAAYLVSQGHKVSEITILAAYLGQVKLLKKKMRSMKSSQPSLFEGNGDDADSGNNEVTIQTIDNYQGDENDFVIISLVRSNDKGKRGLGFVDSENRRCVAQSRAKCGMYFIGDDQTISYSTHWQPVIQEMEKRQELGPLLPLKCPNHSETRVLVRNAKDIPLGIFCKRPCTKMMPCKIHRCNTACQPHHQHEICKTKVAFLFSCGHRGERFCFEKESQMRCERKVPFHHDSCGHLDHKLCYVKKETLHCKQKIDKKLSCGHHVTIECWEHDMKFQCTADVIFEFAKCLHIGMKKCSENESLQKCKQDVYCTLPCGHNDKKKCYQSEKDITCSAKCNKLYPNCRHPCVGRCSQPCIEADCKACEKIRRAAAEKAREEKKRRDKELRDSVEAEIAKLKTKPQSLVRTEITQHGETASEYFNVHDMVIKFIKPQHNWYPTITKIEKLTNNKLLAQHLACKKDLFNPFNAQLKFHGTNKDATFGIADTGFLMPAPNNQMYGPGIYFATDSSKSAQEIYTKGSGMLLLCDVLLGKTHVSKTERKDMNLQKLRKLGCDSLFAPRGSQVQNDEFVVYNPHQALPKYIIHYHKGSAPPVKVTTAPTMTLGKYTILPQRTFKIDDPLGMHLRIVESQFARLHQKHSGIPSIKSVDYFVVPKLVSNFEKQQAKFEAAYGKGTPNSSEVLAFHGTDLANIKNIVNHNFDPAKIRRTAHGYGLYFSEFPDVSTGYGNALLLCRVLPGKSSSHSSAHIPPGHNSIAVNPDAKGHAQMLVIDNPDQILPCYVVHI